MCHGFLYGDSNIYVIVITAKIFNAGGMQGNYKKHYFDNL